MAPIGALFPQMKITYNLCNGMFCMNGTTYNLKIQNKKNKELEK